MVHPITLLANRIAIKRLLTSYTHFVRHFTTHVTFARFETLEGVRGWGCRFIDIHLKLF